jgi:hypothetical protein
VSTSPVLFLATPHQLIYPAYVWSCGSHHF